jgi:DNA-binding XRE family transcriptional regulator
MQTQSYRGIRAFLKAYRRRIDPSSTRVGAYERPNTRCGRRITQEEIAEAIGVSRNWYALLENGAPVRPSLSLLERLADALRLSPAERTKLFLLAIPALQGTVVCPSCGLSQTAYAQSA